MWSKRPPLEAYDPGAEVPPLPPQEDDQPSEIPTEERAALEAGDFEQADRVARWASRKRPPASPPWAEQPHRDPRPAHRSLGTAPEPTENGSEESSQGARGWLKRRRGG